MMLNLRESTEINTLDHWAVLQLVLEYLVWTKSLEDLRKQGGKVSEWLGGF